MISAICPLSDLVVQVLSELKIPASFNPERGSIMILSLGCGEAVATEDPKNQTPEKWSIKDWMTNSPDLVSRGMSGTGHAPNLAFFFPYLTAKRLPYYLRMQPKIPADLAPMDRYAPPPHLRSLTALCRSVFGSLWKAVQDQSILKERRS